MAFRYRLRLHAVNLNRRKPMFTVAVGMSLPELHHGSMLFRRWGLSQHSG
jgi:hypothetical protein